MATILITGGTGMIGTALTKQLLARGYEVIVLTRSKKPANQNNLSYAVWDPSAQTIDEGAIRRSDCIVHLAGAGVAEKRWTKKRKQEIVDSRVKSGELIVKALKEIPNKVKAVISASAIGYYGPDTVPPKAFIETDPPVQDFLSQVVQQWEQAIRKVESIPNNRLVIFRTGIVLSNAGGAYAEFKKPLKFRLATVLGSGQQIVSWIHIDDLIHLYMEAIEHDNWRGVYNAVAPSPVSNARFIKTMQKIYGNYHFRLQVPAFVLKIVLGEMSIEVLKSTTVSSEKIERQGFRFLFPEIETAVKSLKAKEKFT